MRRAPALAAAFLALAAADAAAVNKCIDPSGKVTYQEAPCAKAARQESVKVYAPPAPAKAAPAPAPVAAPSPTLPPEQDLEDPRMQQLVSTLMSYEACETASPDFARAHAPDYAAWRSRNAALLDRLDHSRRYLAVLQVGRRKAQSEVPKAAEARAKYAKSCEMQLGAILKNDTSR